LSRVYSTLIFEGHDLGAGTEVALDPAYLWVVRDIDVFFPGPNTECFLSVIASVVSATIYSIYAPVVSTPGTWNSWRGRQVFSPPADGPTLTISADAVLAGADCRISGYRLTLP